MSVAQRQQRSLSLRQWEAAATRIGRTPIERLNWLLEFSTSTRKELAALAGSKLAQYTFELSAFAAPAERGLAIGSKPLPADRLADLAETVGEGVRFLCDAHPEEGGPEYCSALWYRGTAWHFDMSRFGLLERAIETRTFRTYYTGDLPAVFVMAVMDLLAAEGRRIAKCAWGPCGKLFVRRKRGAYCSRACSQKARTKRYRDAQGSKWKEKRHAYYARRVEKLKGRSVAQPQSCRPQSSLMTCIVK